MVTSRGLCLVLCLLGAGGSVACATGLEVEPGPQGGASNGGGAGGFAGDGSGAGSGLAPAGGAGSGGSGAHGGAGGGPGPVDQECPAGELATNIDAAGNLECAAIDSLVPTAINERCSLYAGWRDNCGACTTAPSKWGRVDGVSCANGLGLNNTCTTPSLGGATVQLFGLNTGGDVDGNDKFSIGMHCLDSPAPPVAGPCAPGELVVGWQGGAAQCAGASSLLSAYFRDHCELYFGWIDSCNGCTTLPTKWGIARSGSCLTGAGANGTCTPTTLGAVPVSLYGLNTAGSVNDDDKFYFGLRCDAAAPAAATATGTCPAGQVVVGTNTDGSIDCESPMPIVEPLVKSGCHVYAGWRDSCSGCTTIPSKWGRVSVDACQNGLGAANTCSVATLGGHSVALFGLNPDGDVDDNDKFYFGLRCE